MGSHKQNVQTQLKNLAGDLFHVHLVEQWIILTNNKFDLKIPDLPPFQTLSVLYNIETRDFVCRTLGRSLERGSFASLEELAQYAQDTFPHKTACIGSGNFPHSSTFSQGCAKYAPLSDKNPDSTEVLNKFRCASCQKHLEQAREPHILDPKEHENNTGMLSKSLDPKLEEHHDPLILVNTVSIDESPDALVSVKAEDEIDSVSEPSAMEMNDLVDYIKDEHDQCFSIFDSDTSCLRKSKRIRTVKPSDPLKSQPKHNPSPSPSTIATLDKKIEIIYPKNINHKPNAEGKYGCEHCGHVYTTRQGKNNHKKFNHGWGHFPCEYCPTVYKEALDFIGHMMKSHVGISEAMCPQCQKRVHFEGDGQVFAGHYIACFRSHWMNANARRATNRRENQPEPSECTCDTCGQVFKSSTSLKFHQRIHEGKGFVCKDCGFWTSHRSKLASHMKKHEVEQGTAIQLICPHCAKVCSGDSMYNAHVNRHHQPFHCTQCPKVLLGLLLFNKHNSEVHGANKCDTCGMCFSTNFLLRRHKLTHLEPAFNCQFCPKKFKTERCLENHERVHTGETPYECRLCDYKCKSSATLSLHKKFKHNGGRRLRKPLTEEGED